MSSLGGAIVKMVTGQPSASKASSSERMKVSDNFGKRLTKMPSGRRAFMGGPP